MEKIITEVLVIGSGAAGISAAISSARNGAKTILIEREGYPGGLSSIMPWLGFHDREYRKVVKGLAEEYVTKLQEKGWASEYIFDIKCGSFVSLNSHMWKCLAYELLHAAGVQVMLHTIMVDAIVQQNTISSVKVRNSEGFQNIDTKIVIDCTGDGSAASLAGAKFEIGRREDGLVQSPSLVFTLAGIDKERFVNACKNPDYNYREWIQNYPELREKTYKRLSQTDAFILGGFASTIEKARENGDYNLPQSRVIGVKTHIKDEMIVAMNRILGLDPTSSEDTNCAYKRLYGQIPILERFFRKYMPGFNDAYVSEIAPILGIRESRRIIGDYVLTADDVINGVQFKDQVAMGAYHIDIHRPKGTWVESHNVQAYGIPLRCLVSASLENLMMAGKCISASHEAIASSRVIPICMAEGQAAGTAAALTVSNKKPIREIQISVLQEILQNQGAELGLTIGDPNTEIIECIGQLPLQEPLTEGNDDKVSQQNNSWLRSK